MIKSEKCSVSMMNDSSPRNDRPLSRARTVFHPGRPVPAARCNPPSPRTQQGHSGDPARFWPARCT